MNPRMKQAISLFGTRRLSPQAADVRTAGNEIQPASQPGSGYRAPLVTADITGDDVRDMAAKIVTNHTTGQGAYPTGVVALARDVTSGKVDLDRCDVATRAPFVAVLSTWAESDPSILSARRPALETAHGLSPVMWRQQDFPDFQSYFGTFTSSFDALARAFEEGEHRSQASTGEGSIRQESLLSGNPGAATLTVSGVPGGPVAEFLALRVQVSSNANISLSSISMTLTGTLASPGNPPYAPPKMLFIPASGIKLATFYVIGYQQIGSMLKPAFFRVDPTTPLTAVFGGTTGTSVAVDPLLGTHRSYESIVSDLLSGIVRGSEE